MQSYSESLQRKAETPDLRMFSTPRTKGKGNGTIQISFMDWDIKVVVCVKLILDDDTPAPKARSLTRRMRKSKPLRDSIDDAVVAYLMICAEDRYEYENDSFTMVNAEA